MNNSNQIQQIAPQHLKGWLDEHKPLILIDTLPEEQYRRVHLPRANNACVYQVTFLDQTRTIAPDKSAQIVVYGADDRTLDAQTAAAKLLRAGHQHVTLLTGGLAAWRAAGLPLEGETPDAPEPDETAILQNDRTYAVDAENSLIEWAGRNPNSKHHGTVRLTEGQIRVAGGQVNGRFTINMNSIKNTNLQGDELQPVLIEHLKSDDFFFTQRFPQAVFEINTAQPVAEPSLSAPNYAVDGTLDLCGIQAPLSFTATVNPVDGGAISAEAHFDIDRTRWGIVYGSSRFFKHLGMHLVFDLISLQIKVVAR